MRLTNPVDQGYVRKLLPDSLGTLIDKMPAFKQGEALLVGESIALPSVVQIEVCTVAPASTDIPYWALWQQQWKDLAIDKIRDERLQIGRASWRKECVSPCRFLWAPYN